MLLWGRMALGYLENGLWVAGRTKQNHHAFAWLDPPKMGNLMTCVVSVDEICPTKSVLLSIPLMFCHLMFAPLDCQKETRSAFLVILVSHQKNTIAELELLLEI